MYPEPKSVDLVDTCLYCDGTPHIVCHECKVLHCALNASILCQSEICVGLRHPGRPTLLLLLLRLLLLLLLLLLTPVLVCLLLLLLLPLTPVVVCGSVARVPKMLMVN